MRTKSILTVGLTILGLGALGAVVGTTKDARGTPLWAADEVVYAPAIAVTGVHVDAIAGFMEGLD